jgi:hypothetical protein
MAAIIPDLLATLYDYPGVTVNLHCNQNNEAGEPIIFYGREATMVINGNTLTVTPQDTSPKPEGYSLNGWTAEAKQQYLDDWHNRASRAAGHAGRSGDLLRAAGYDDTADHIANFFHAVKRASTWWRTRSSATTLPLPATWPTTLTSIAIATWDAAAQSIKG